MNKFLRWLVRKKRKFFCKHKFKHTGPLSVKDINTGRGFIIYKKTCEICGYSELYIPI